MSLLNIYLLCVWLLHYSAGDYSEERRKIITKEASELIGSSITLTAKEEKVNKILMNFKHREMDEGFINPSIFPPSLHFFHSKKKMEKSQVFKLIRAMPKGGSLHMHTTAMLSSEALLNLTYEKNLLGCYDDESFRMFRLRFSKIPSSRDCEWKPLRQWRDEVHNFDDFLKSQMTMIVNDPLTAYPNINSAWEKFQNIFAFNAPLFSYRPFIRKYFLKVFHEFYEDNVMYLETRGAFLKKTYDSYGNAYKNMETVQFYLDVLNDFLQTHPDFIGLRIIFASSRSSFGQNIDKTISSFRNLQKRYPNLVAGFDLVGQEDSGEPLSAFTKPLLDLSSNTKFFFHAGETNWYGTSVDMNLIDAVLLNTSRIGHGFALVKHPEVLRIVKEKRIAVEINPISNQVLKLVLDVRNHAGASLMAQGCPVVITCDDPSMWGARGLSYDFYLAFMGMTPRDGDLRILKQLALNSLIYSGLDSETKDRALKLFEKKWDIFLDKVLQNY